MPVGYLITVALAALGTVFALAPPHRPRWLAAIGFRVGVVVHELPGAQHAFDVFHSIRFEAVVDAIALFTAWVRAKQRPASLPG